MLRFRGFKASFKLNSEKSSGVAQSTVYQSTVSISGAYRVNKDELFGSLLYPESPKKISPSMVKLPSARTVPPNTQSKSTSDLTALSKQAINVRKSTTDLSQTTNSQPTQTNAKVQNKVEKQRLADQKKREKLAAKEREREEKMKKRKEREEKNKNEKQRVENIKRDKEREETLKKKGRQRKEKVKNHNEHEDKITKNKEREEKNTKEKEREEKIQINTERERQIKINREREEKITKDRQREEKTKREREMHIEQSKTEQDTTNYQKKPKKRIAPKPQQGQNSQTNTQSKPPVQARQYSTNTLESSISKNSGPPAYSSIPAVPANRSRDNGNTTFVEPEDDMSSWGLISQHRQQINRQAGTLKRVPKQTHLDLHYNVGSPGNEKDA